MGQMLEAPREGDWGLRLELGFLALVGEHFQTVRLPVRWTNHAAPTADAALESRFAARVDQAVDNLLDRGVHVILNVHHYNQIMGLPVDRNEAAVDPAVVEERLVNIWRQLGRRYQDRSRRLVFELLNEPYGQLDGEPWNRLLPRLLAAVRETNPDRAVIVGPSYWNNAIHLPLLKLPRDPNIIVAVHNFHPFEFTHQGEKSRNPPFPLGVTCCNAAQRRTVVEQFDMATRWSRRTGYPLHLGEFGVIKEADPKSRAAYARLVRDEAERRGIGWAYWEFAAGFGVYSPATREWIEPLRQALLGE
jgi:endoglucanase